MGQFNIKRGNNVIYRRYLLNKKAAIAAILLIIIGTVTAWLSWNYLRPSATVIFLYSDTTSQHVLDAHKQTASILIDKINTNGGVAGFRVIPQWVATGKGDATGLSALIGVSQFRPIAVIGETSSQRGKKVATYLQHTGIPYFGIFSVADVARDFPDLYLLASTTSQGEEAWLSQLSENGTLPSRKSGFIGYTENIYSKKLKELITKKGDWVTADLCSKSKDADLNIPEDILKTDLMVVSCGMDNNIALIRYVRKHGGNQPILVTLSYLKSILALADSDQLGNLYGISGTLSNIDLRLRKLHSDPTLGLNKYLPEDVSSGALRADTVALLDEATRRTEKPIRDRESLISAIKEGLTPYTRGEIFKTGAVHDIAFTPERTAAGDRWLLWKAPGRDVIILAPKQFTTRDGKLIPVDVVYVDLDVNSVGDVTFGQFSADMLITLVAKKGVDIQRLRFANNVPSPNGTPTLDIAQVSDQSSSIEGFRELIYRVRGKFSYSSRLSKFPFDTQTITIDILPSDIEHPITIQPTSSNLLDTDFEIDGWKPLSAYVGNRPDITMLTDPQTGKRRFMKVYKFSYAFEIHRTGGDFIFKVVLPLSSVLFLAYMSSLLQDERCDAKLSVQVSALLTVIALYFTIQKPDANTATIADSLIIWSVVALTYLIALSIIRIRMGVTRTFYGIGLRHIKLAGFLLLLAPGAWALI